MKKIAFFIFLLLFFPLKVIAADLVIDELNILNGGLSIPFESLNNEYTVILNSNEYQIEFEYEVDDNIEVFVENNYDLVNNSIVTVLLKNEKSSVEYHFQVLKEEEEKTQVTFLEETQPLETNFMFEYKNVIIPISCLILIFIVFKLLFHHHKK